MKPSVIAICLASILGILSIALASAQGQSESAQSETAESMELVLDGLVLAENPADSLALLRRAGARRARPLRIGEEYAGYLLKEVQRGQVVLENARGGVRLYVAGEAPATASATPLEREEDSDTEPSHAPGGSSAVPVVAVAGGGQSDLESDGWIRRAFSRRSANDRLRAEIPLIITQTNVVPFKGDGVAGLQLAQVPDGTLIEETGLLAGDVLLSLNGEQLRSLDTLVRLLPSFRTQDEIRLVIDRGGEVLQLAYDIQ